jgi:hypothetical protein
VPISGEPRELCLDRLRQSPAYLAAEFVRDHLDRPGPDTLVRSWLRDGAPDQDADAVAPAVVREAGAAGAGRPVVAS